MNDKQSEQPSPYERENKAAERLAELLESPGGAQKLGDEAYEIAKEEIATGKTVPR